MKIDILTLFPSMFVGPFDTSMLKKAQDNNILEVNIHDLREYSQDKHKTVDDRPFGGGPGMVLKINVIDNALKNLKTSTPGVESRIILLTPQGKLFNQKKAVSLSMQKHIILIAGHYEGFDHRIRKHLIDEEISIGKYVLTGGEIPAMIITDAVARLLPGVLSEEAKSEESFMNGETLDYPVYTRPKEYNNWKVPEVLLSGNHAEIEKWREENKKSS